MHSIIKAELMPFPGSCLHRGCPGLLSRPSSYLSPATRLAVPPGPIAPGLCSVRAQCNQQHPRRCSDHLWLGMSGGKTPPLCPTTPHERAGVSLPSSAPQLWFGPSPTCVCTSYTQSQAPTQCKRVCAPKCQQTSQATVTAKGGRQTNVHWQMMGKSNVVDLH